MIRFGKVLMDQPLFQTPRGTKDILPDEQKYWAFLREAFEGKVRSFGCGKIETPTFEYADVFNRTLGVSSDIVSKEMYEVHRAKQAELQERDEDNRTLILRPEMTAGVARSYIQHGMKTWPQPVKLYYEGPLFRYDRPQAGRYRIHHQFGVEIIGEVDPLLDASLIYLAFQIFKKVGLDKNIIIDINSVGCQTCRPKMRKKLLEYFEKFLPSMCDDCKRRFVENPLRILDCKNNNCQQFIAAAPQPIDSLCTECKTHFKVVLESLDSLQIPYNLNPRLVRGLDYYTKTVFEFFSVDSQENRLALGGGGRYDGLLKLFGETSTPAVGFGMGAERVIEQIKSREIEVPDTDSVDVCIATIGEKALKKCLPLIADLDSHNVEATCIIGKESLKAQIKQASKMKAKFCLIIGQREVLDNSVIVRDMIDASQETVKMEKLIDLLKKRLHKEQ